MMRISTAQVYRSPATTIMTVTGGCPHPSPITPTDQAVES